MLRKNSFQKKIFIYYFVLLTAVIFLATTIANLYISRVLKQKEHTNMQQLNTMISTQLDNVIKEMDTLSLQVIFSKQIQDILYNAKQYDTQKLNYFDTNRLSRSRAQEILLSINSTRDIARRISIYNNNQNFISVGTVTEDPNAIYTTLKTRTWDEQLLDEGKKYILRPPHPDGWISSADTINVISLERPVHATLSASAWESSYYQQSQPTGEILGFVEIQQPYSLIQNICQTDNIPNYKVIVSDQKGNLIYPKQLGDGELIYYLNAAKQGKAANTDSYTKNDELITSTVSQQTGWSVITAQPESDFMKPVYKIQHWILGFSFLLFTVTLVLILFITKSLTTPIRELRRSLKNISLNNLSLDIDTTGENNEILLLSQAFHETLNRLNESVNQTIEARTSEAHAHLMALQAQMNPHFLYNTLMSLSSIGVETGNREIVTICAQISDMLRYTASYRNKKVTLADELKHAENYLNLIKRRYEDLIEYEMEIDDPILLITVPKLILQPLIENCINHGFKDSRPPWKILVKGYIADNCWFMQITDNGGGFKLEYLNELNEKLNQYRNSIIQGDIPMQLEVSGMGILNIFIRLHIQYQENAVFEIHNNEDSTGATIIVGGLIHVDDNKEQVKE